MQHLWFYRGSLTEISSDLAKLMQNAVPIPKGVTASPGLFRGADVAPDLLIKILEQSAGGAIATNSERIRWQRKIQRWHARAAFQWQCAL